MINVPSKTDKQLLKDFIDLYTDVEGLPSYPKKKYSKIKHQTGTRIDNVTNNMNNILALTLSWAAESNEFILASQNTLTATAMYKVTAWMTRTL